MNPAPPEPTLTIRGVQVFKEWLTPQAQAAMAHDLFAVIPAAPLFQPEPRHPSGVSWPPIPATVLAVWDAVTGLDRRPDCCLVNWYAEGARMGLHQDRDEADFSFPVVSISLGDSALFRIGSVERGGRTESLWLESGDVLVMGGAARLVHHGIDRVRAGSSALWPGGGRINLTLRVVD